MVLRKKRCATIILIVSFILLLLWAAGNRIIDVKLDGYEVRRETSFISGSSEGTLSEAFKSLPAEGVGVSRIELFDDNPRAWAARWRLLSEAREKLEVSYFILDADIFGFSFLGHLLHKAQEGIQVRILLDAIGTVLSREIRGNDYLDALADNQNITIKMYRPYFFRFRDTFLTLNPFAFLASDHDKILIADGRRALIGGRNIAREYLADPFDYPRSFRDADVMLESTGTGGTLQAIFNAGFGSAKAHGVGREAVDIKNSGADLLLAYEAMDAWLGGRAVSGETARTIRDRGLTWLDDLEKQPRLRGALRKKNAGALYGEVRVLDSSPRLFKSDDAISRGLERLTGAARSDIFVQTPYLILSTHVVSILAKAAARGVRITIFTNSPVSTDNPMSQAFFLEQWPEVMAQVPALRLFVAGDTHNIHAKIGAIDGMLALIGTYNLDPLSMAFNGELAVAVWSEEFAEQLTAKPRQRIAEGQPGVFEYRIARDAQGRPKRDRDGRVEIAFGPEDHSSPDQWKTVQLYRKLLRVAAKLPGTGPLLWNEKTTFHAGN